METKPIAGLTLFFEATDQEAAELIGQACERSVRLIREHWGFATPKDCRVYVMTSWPGFMFHAAPWYWWPLLAISMPLWYFRVRKLWEYAGGWAQRYGKRSTVGVKPPRLIKTANRSIGKRIFIEEEDVGKKVGQLTCHELVHALAAHLKLPMWLNEGLAMLTVDKYTGKTTVRIETLEALTGRSHKAEPGSYRKMRIEDEDEMVYQYVRGYWITRYIEDTQPELLKDMLAKRSPQKDLERTMASTYRMTPPEFWSEIDGAVVSYFKQKGPGA